MDIFKIKDYRKIIENYIKSNKNKHLSLSRIAKECRISPSTLSLMLQEKRELTKEQGVLIAEYLGFTSLESDFFLNLIGESRAGNIKLKEYYQKKNNIIIKEAYKVKNLAKEYLTLPENLAYVYYSHWSYSAIRLLYSINKDYSSVDIADLLELPKNRIKNQIQELLQSELLKKSKNGEISVGPKRTHLPEDSPLVISHHLNWRKKASSYIDKMSDDNLFLTCPLSISHDDAFEVKTKLLKIFEEIIQKSIPSDPEEARCINIDFFKL